MNTTKQYRYSFSWCLYWLYLGWIRCKVLL